MTPLEKLVRIIDPEAGWDSLKVHRIAGGGQFVSTHLGANSVKRMNDALAKAKAILLAIREPSEGMHAALSELGRITVEDAHERDNWCWFAVKGYRAMIDALIGEGEVG